MAMHRTTNNFKPHPKKTTPKVVPHIPVEFHKIDDRRTKPRGSGFAQTFHDAWRPAMGWLYGFLCLFDFFLAPILWPLVLLAEKQPITQWQPITTASGGLVHISFAAIVGVSAWTRGKEKASPWAMLPQMNQGFSGTTVEIADNQGYIDPERRYGNGRT